MSDTKAPPEIGLEVRALAPGDFGFCLAQSEREGWDTTVATLAMHRAHDPDGCFIGEVEGQPAGMVTTTRYHLTGWIGNLLVPPKRRGLGIGTLLMKRAIAHLERDGAATIRLEADPMGINIYRRLGFVDEFESPRFRREPRFAPEPAACAEMSEAELAELEAFDARRKGAHGGPNHGRHRALLRDRGPCGRRRGAVRARVGRTAPPTARAQRNGAGAVFVNLPEPAASWLGWSASQVTRVAAGPGSGSLQTQRPRGPVREYPGTCFGSSS